MGATGTSGTHRSGKPAAGACFTSHVLLLIDLLERETNERVYGSLAVALGNCAEQAEKCETLDTEGVLPVWKASDQPILVRRRLFRLEVYSEFESPLNRLVNTEPGDPKVMPWSGYSGFDINPNHVGIRSQAAVRQRVFSLRVKMGLIT